MGLVPADPACGFSFADLAADYAGIALALDLMKSSDVGKDRLAILGRRFKGSDFLPEIGDLEDGERLPQLRT